MARPKEFIREDALEKAITVFANHGFAGASTDTLRHAMGLSRQSMYDTFGDKRSLYLEALRRYNSASVAAIIRTLLHEENPLRAIELALQQFAAQAAKHDNFGCMGLNSICEFGTSDNDVNAINAASGQALLSAFEQAISRGQQGGVICRTLNAADTAHYLNMTLAGLKLRARAGVDVMQQQAMIQLALRALKAA